MNMPSVSSVIHVSTGLIDVALVSPPRGFPIAAFGGLLKLVQTHHLGAAINRVGAKNRESTRVWKDSRKKAHPTHHEEVVFLRASTEILLSFYSDCLLSNR